tara:strand:- start:110 stop:673 length:564 start_codon:yes stop_codon:yes gene_type:complete
MKIIQLKSDEINHINYLSILHKKVFEGTIATSLMTNNLSRLYRLLIKNKIISVNVAFDNDENFLGALTVKKKSSYKIKMNLIDTLKIIFISLQGLLLHPFIWMREYYFKIGLYKGIDSKINIITLFVDTDYQGKGVGEQLIQNIKDQYKRKISVDTRSDNQKAIDFYIKNGFVLKNQNIRNTSMYFD